MSYDRNYRGAFKLAKWKSKCDTDKPAWWFVGKYLVKSMKNGWKF